MPFLTQVRRTLKQIPFMQAVHRAWREPPGFRSSDQYWKARYRRQGNSGSGSYGRLAQFKAQVLNEFVREHRVASVIEWGCGDGNQQALADYPRYVGVDISKQAIKLCRRRFAHDPSKRFLLSRDAERLGIEADLALSLDVLYHLVEDSIFENYMQSLLRSAVRYVGIYSSNHDEPGHVPHVRHRSFSGWMARNAPDWHCSGFVDNPYPYDAANPEQTSWAHFGFYQRVRD